MKRRSGTAGLILVLILAAPAFAAPEDVANDISRNVMSPFCPGVTLHDCPSDSAVQLRERIVAWADRGFTEDQIMARLESEYGSAIRAVPDAGGEGILAWILPAAAGLAGAAMAWRYARRWATRPEVPKGYNENVHISDEDRRRLDAELRRFTGET